MNIYFSISIFQLDTTVISVAAVFFEKAAIIIVMLGQKTYCQLNKVIHSGMYNCIFEAIN